MAAVWSQTIPTTNADLLPCGSPGTNLSSEKVLTKCRLQNPSHFIRLKGVCSLSPVTPNVSCSVPRHGTWTNDDWSTSSCGPAAWAPGPWKFCEILLEGQCLDPQDLRRCNGFFQWCQPFCIHKVHLYLTRKICVLCLYSQNLYFNGAQNLYRGISLHSVPDFCYFYLLESKAKWHLCN